MIKSFSVGTLIILCAALIESVILSNIMFLPAVPDLVLICVLFISLHNGKLVGEGSGFVSGLMLDFLSASPPGLNALYRTLLGYVGGLFTKSLNTEGFFIPMLLGLCASVSKVIMLWIVSVLYPSDLLSFTPFTWTVLFEIGLNTILTPFIFKFLNLFKNTLVLRPETIV